MLQALNQRIENLEGGEDQVFERIAAGERIADIANSLGVSRPMLYTWRNMEPHRKRRQEKWHEAMRLSAEAKAEEGEDILDAVAGKVGLTQADVSAAVARAKYKQWLAERRDPDTFGGKQDQVQVNVSIGALHLDALRRRGVTRELPMPTLEAEVVGEEPETEG